MSDLVSCGFPKREDYPDNDEPPEGWDEWRTSSMCRHLECQEANYYARLYAGSPKPLTHEEKEEIESDHEFMREHMHGRDLDGVIR